MIEEIVKAGVGTILSQGFLGGLLLLSWVLFGLVLKYVLKQNATAKTECEAARSAAETEYKTQFEKRLEEARETLAALNRASAAMDALKISVDARTVALNELTVGFAKYVSEQDSRNGRWSDFRRTLEAFHGDVLRMLNELLSRGPRR